MSTPAPTPIHTVAPVTARPSGEPAEERLPIDLRTTLVGIRRRIPLAVLIAVFGALLGALSGYLFGNRVYQATTVLLYRPPAGASADSEGNEAPSLKTQVDLVKMPANLEEVRRRLRLSTELSTLGGAFEVQVPENTSLLSIRTTWDEPEMTATLANTLRDVFQESQRAIARAEAQSKMKDLEARLARVVEQQSQADSALKEYSTEHDVVDLDKEAQWYLEQLINTELIYEQAIGEKQAVDLQQANLSRLVGDLKSKVAAEERALETMGSSGKDTTGGTDSALHGRMAIVDLKQRELERAQALSAKGLISKSQEDQMRAALEVERYAVFNNSPTAGVLKDMLIREMNINLDAIASERKVSQLGEAVARVKNKLKKLPVTQREFVGLKREVDAREAERERLEQLVSGERRKVESETFGFNLVSAAKPPVLPLRSNRKLLALSISAVGVMFGLGLIVLLEFSDTRVKSAAEAELKLGVPVLAAVPTYEIAGSALAAEQFLAAYQKLRRRWPEPGLTFMVSSAVGGGQSAHVALELARTIADHEGSVLLIDAETRRVDRTPATPRPAAKPAGRLGRMTEAATALATRTWGRWAQPGTVTAAAGAWELVDEDGPGLRDYLRGTVANWHDLLKTDEPSGVLMLPRGGHMASTGLASARMQELVRDARAEFGCVVIHATAVLPLADAGFLSRYVDAAIVEVSSSRNSVESGRRALQQLREGPAPVAGVVLTGVDPVYLESHWA